MRNGRLTEPHAHGIEVLEVGIGQIRIALREVVDGLIHPVALVGFLGLDLGLWLEANIGFAGFLGNFVFILADLLLLLLAAGGNQDDGQCACNSRCPQDSLPVSAVAGA